MSVSVRRFTVALTTALGVTLSGMGVGHASTPDPWLPLPAQVEGQDCLYREAPPPLDGETFTPLPVPESVPGGDRLGECGDVVPENAAAPPAGVNADAWIVADLDTGAVLAARDPHGRHRPATTIKVLTALTALRQLNLDDLVAATPEDVAQVGVKVELAPGTEYTVRQLVQALVMGSGNDAAHALARHLGGVGEALGTMNGVAQEIGALDTRAGTESGLHHADASISAFDAALLFRTALQEPEFAEAAGNTQLDMPGVPGGVVTNSSELMTGYEGALGGLGGATDESGFTFVGGAERDGRRLVVALLRASAEPGIAQQAGALLDYGFSFAGETDPVGSLVVAGDQEDSEEEAAGEAGETAEGGEGGEGGDEAGGDEGGADSEDAAATQTASGFDPFGTIGLPLTALAGAAILFFAFLTLRDRRARKLAAARRAAKEQEEAQRATEDWLWPPNPRT
ncbi:D-alanyl-D-alanine carboxypeptidase family protein [Actinoalloteichus hymeniacidonis]|uniref:D-alanyl-D-alanine carboxypeptidase family protein n=1 Tax=Actinoalloteichus hymeniacidonis TaxID=340345 RepID=UPI001622C3A7|nr:serine hydrolase [Actinoalloteichus hymeniacidonis]MBB5906243.1 D-alanyl-D-alanine carboxypeptidase (penicillin-binding protein 5/6) [Actinoalloteichus hymeniacidonis]